MNKDILLKGASPMKFNIAASLPTKKAIIFFEKKLMALKKL
jgi:hypothetical protein